MFSSNFCRTHPSYLGALFCLRITAGRANASGMPKAVTVQATPFMSKDRCAAAAFKAERRRSNSTEFAKGGTGRS